MPSQPLRYIVRQLLLRSPLRHYALYRYEYNFTPEQLCFLCKCLGASENIDGSILEIGCAFGHTTVFLNKHLDAIGSKRKYTCIDTFSGFTSDDIQVEVAERNKNADQLRHGFSENSLNRFNMTMNFNHVDRVKGIKADVSTVDFALLGPISFCLLDVDLYRPTKNCLPKIFEQLSVGGKIVIDDCLPQNRYDGAYQAYMEFTQERGLTPMFECGKLGIITKNTEVK